MSQNTINVNNYWKLETRYRKAARCWANAIKRCYDIDDYSYSLYGARSIVVCEHWLDPSLGVVNFISDMGLPAPGQSLDRIDSNGNYEPSNCRWIDRAEQNRNRSNNVIVNYHGEDYLFIELCRKKNLHPSGVRGRIQKLKWTVEDAFDRPGLSKTFADYESALESRKQSPNYRDQNSRYYQNAKAHRAAKLQQAS